MLLLHQRGVTETTGTESQRGHSSTLRSSSLYSLILDLVARELARKHAAIYDIGFPEAKAMFKQKLARKWGHTIARGWATLILDRLRDFVVAPSSVGGNSSPLHDSQGVDELATLDHYHHFQGHSGLCA